MRRILYCLMLGACLALPFSCREKQQEPEEEAPKLELDAQTQALFAQGVSFGAEEGLEVTLRFSANKPWGIDLVVPSKAVSWIKARPESGTAGDAVVTLTAQPNTSPEERSAVLSLFCGELEKEMKITQNGKEIVPPPPPEPVAVEKVTLSPESMQMLVGESAEISYTVCPENADIESVVWSSSDESVAKVADGKVTAVGAGSAVVSLKVNEVEARCAVSVEIPYIAVESVSLSATEITLAPGDETTLTATVLPQDATDPSVVWFSSDEAVATVKGGLVKAVGEGTAVITAQAGEKEAKCAVTVKKEFVPVSSITLSDSVVQLAPGETKVLTATVLPADATDPSVTWSSSDENVATVSDGTVTAVAAGSAVITARAGEQEARCSILVEIPFVAVTSISLAPTEMTLSEGDESYITATVLPADATDPHVEFRSSDTSVATVDNGGKVTACGPGTATVTARAGDCEAECRVTVEAKTIAVEAIALNQAALTLEIGESYELIASVYPADATDPKVVWYSSDLSVATVAGGLVKALKAGVAIITARSGDAEASCEVTVNAPYVPVESISLDKTELSLAKGDSFTLTATVLPADATDSQVSWSSSNNTVAKVDENGTVTAVRVGSAVITAKVGTLKATCKVTVSVKATSISLNYTTYTMRPLETLQLYVKPKPTDAAVGEIQWSSSNTDVATVDENGKVTAYYDGTAVIKAIMDELEATCTIKVSSTATGSHEGTQTEEWN